MNLIQKIEEKKYQTELRDFQYKNPSATEEFYIRYRIRVIERYLPECEETADFIKGELMDGLEIVDGVPTTTKLGTASDFFYWDKELQNLKNRLQRLNEPIQPEPKATVQKDYKEQTPFLVGMKFATGEAQELYKKYKGDKGQFKKICLELKFKATDRPYFSETINNNRGGKNLYNNTKVFTEVYKYCIENQIPMCNDFIEKYNLIEPE